jgi:CO/xanthine dehydrogenase Mo-binding subunit
VTALGRGDPARGRLVAALRHLAARAAECSQGVHGQAFAYVLRSPHAHARIRKLDLAAARAATGAGEAGTVGALPAIVNAFVGALAPLGVKSLDMPATSERIWQAMRDARA